MVFFKVTTYPSCNLPSKHMAKNVAKQLEPKNQISFGLNIQCPNSNYFICRWTSALQTKRAPTSIRISGRQCEVQMQSHWSTTAKGLKHNECLPMSQLLFTGSLVSRGSLFKLQLHAKPSTIP